MINVSSLAEMLSLEALNVADGSREVTGGYTGDLLSWVMGRAKSGDVWITIMTNINILAVATLSDVSCIIVAENSEIASEIIETAKAKAINLYRSSENAFELCRRAGALLG